MLQHFEEVAEDEVMALQQPVPPPPLSARAASAAVLFAIAAKV